MDTHISNNFIRNKGLPTIFDTPLQNEEFWYNNVPPKNCKLN